MTLNFELLGTWHRKQIQERNDANLDRHLYRSCVIDPGVRSGHGFQQSALLIVGAVAEAVVMAVVMELGGRVEQVVLLRSYSD